MTVVAQAAASLALMRLAPTCFCAEEQPQQLRQRDPCITPQAITRELWLLSRDCASQRVATHGRNRRCFRAGTHAPESSQPRPLEVVPTMGADPGRELSPNAWR